MTSGGALQSRGSTMPLSLSEPSAPLAELKSSSLGEHLQASPYPPNHTWATSTARAQATTTPRTWSVTRACHRGDDLGKNLGMMESFIYRCSPMPGSVEYTQEHAIIQALRGTRSRGRGGQLTACTCARTHSRIHWPLH